MPRSDDLLRLRDIRAAIEKIQGFTRDEPDWATSRSDVIWDAVMYNVAVIGEAVKALSQETKDLAPEADWSPAARMRDVVIHRYTSTDPVIVDETVREDLPRLLAEVVRLMEALERPS